MAKKKDKEKKGLSAEDIVAVQQDLLKRLGRKVSLGADIRDSDLQSISTGSVKLDWALGTPFVEGSINEIYGENQTGKTTLALEISASAIKLGKPVFFFDIERKLRESQLNMIKGLSGESRKLFTRIRPDTGEESVDIIHDCIIEAPGCLIVFDSISGMMPEVEGAESATKETMGKVAKLTWKMVRKCLGPAERTKSTIVFISHIAPKLNPYQTGDLRKGGRAIMDMAAQIVKLKRTKGDLIKDSKGNIVGQNTQCTVIKNNMARPFREVTIPIIYGRGIDKSVDLLQLAKDLCIIDYSNGWFTYKETDESEGVRKREADILQIIKNDIPYRNMVLAAIQEILGS